MFKGNYASLLIQKIELISLNEELKKENEELKKECKTALFEVDKCIITIESIKQNGNNHN